MNKLIQRYCLLCIVAVLTLGSCHRSSTETRNSTTQSDFLSVLDSLIVVNPQYALSQIELAQQQSHISSYLARLYQAKALAVLGQNAKAFDIVSDLLQNHKANSQIQTQYARFELGRLYYYQGDYSKSLQIFDSLYGQQIQLPDSLLLGRVLLFRGKALRVLGRFEQSQNCYEAARRIALLNNDKKLLATVLMSMGKNHILGGNRKLALKNYLEAYKLSEHLGDFLLLGDVCNHLGGYYLQTKQYEKALEYHHLSLQYRLRLAASDEIGSSYNNLGKTFLDMNQLDSAVFYFQRSIEYFKASNYLKGLVKSHTSMGKLKQQQGKMLEAKQQLQRAYALSTATKYNLGVAESGIALGNFYLGVKNADSALYFFTISAAIIKNAQYDDLLIDIYNGQYKAWLQKKQFQPALAAHERLLGLEKQKLNTENNRQMNSLWLEFETERKEQDNRILKQNNELQLLKLKRNRLTLWFVAIALVLTIVLCLLIYNRLKFKEHAHAQLELLNRQIIQQNNDLEELNAQLKRAGQDKDKLFSIISHELRNPLFWFQNLAMMLSRNYKNMSEDKLQKAILSLNESAQNVYHLMDNLLFWSRAQLNRIVPRKAEFVVADKIDEIIRLFRNVLEIKEIDFTCDLQNTSSITADPELFASIIRNLLSNAIKFTPNKGTVRISISQTTTNLQVSISDSGIGLSAQAFDQLFSSIHTISVPGILNEKGSGIGLKLCKEFIELHGGTIGIAPTQGNGTKICFEIPV